MTVGLDDHPVPRRLRGAQKERLCEHLNRAMANKTNKTKKAGGKVEDKKDVAEEKKVEKKAPSSSGAPSADGKADLLTFFLRKSCVDKNLGDTEIRLAQSKMSMISVGAPHGVLKSPEFAERLASVGKTCSVFEREFSKAFESTVDVVMGMRDPYPLAALESPVHFYRDALAGVFWKHSYVSPPGSKGTRTILARHKDKNKDTDKHPVDKAAREVAREVADRGYEDAKRFILQVLKSTAKKGEIFVDNNRLDMVPSKFDEWGNGKPTFPYDQLETLDLLVLISPTCACIP